MTEPSKIHGRTRAQWESMCLNKSRYTSDAVARAVGQWALNQPETTATKLYTYTCPNCRGWHLTRSKGLNKNTPPVTKDELYGSQDTNSKAVA